MDDSDREHSYDYDIDEGDEEEDDEPHDDYEDVPDDDEEDEDDMEEDEDDEDEEDAVFVEPMAAAINPADPLSTTLSNALNELRSFRTRANLPYITTGVSARPLSNGHTFENFLGDSPLITIPSRSALNAAAAELQARHSLRSVVLETFDPAGRLTSHEPFRGPDSLAALTACLRGGLSALPPSRYWFGDQELSGPPSAIHPMLCRPPTVPSQEMADAAVSIFSSLRRDGSQEPIAVDSLSIPRLPDSDAQVDIPRVRIAQSFQNIRDALDVVDSSTGPSARSEDPAERPEAERASGSMSEPPPTIAATGSTPTAVDVAAAASLASLRQGGQAGPSNVGGLPSGASEDVPQGQADDISTYIEAALSGGDGRSQAEVLRELSEQDLARSVDPVGSRSSMENVIGMLSRSRHTYERIVNRDRDREKISSGILKRWVYDPPSCGGDSLPPIFDTEMAQRNNRHNGRATGLSPGQPLIAPETHEAVNRLSSRIINSLDLLMTDLMKVDAKVADQESKEKARKEAEEKKRNEDEEKSKGNVSEVDKEKEEASMSGERQSDTAGPPREAGSLPQVSVTATDGSPTNGENQEEQTPLQGLTERHVSENENEANGIMADTPAEVRADAEMSTADDDHGNDEEQTHARSQADEANGDRSGDVGREGRGTAEPDAPGAPSASASNDLSAVVAQRAAAAGISLDAPANENPEVVAAATESTGIDPAFLAALPEDMRAEILTQYYEQIHTNAGGDAGSAASPAATTVNQDFLIALPPALRSEVLALEAEFQSRQQTAGAGSNTGNGEGSDSNQDGDASGSGGGIAGAEMDNATFLATLAPDLREEILLTSGEAFIQSLPPNVAAEARILREREAVSRFPWRVNGEFPVGFDSRRFPNGLRGPGQTQARQPSRNQPRETPRYRWKKVENGWLREAPIPSLEPQPSLKSDGLSSLIDLLWMKQGHYGKTRVNQVLSHACKSTESRLLVLKELLMLILGSRDGTPISSSPQLQTDVERSRRHGTAVRRALELLTFLCKNDVVVAESLLGLPQTNDDLALVPSAISETTVIPCKDSDISLSTLVAQLDTPLFVRSTSHLEQLVGLIDTLCMALPATLCDESDKRNDGRSGSRRRRIPGAPAALNSSFHEPMNFLLVDADAEGVGDPPTVFVADDGDDEEEDSEEDPFESATLPRAERESSRQPSTSPDTSKVENDKNVSIPPQYRIPGFNEKDLVALTRVLVRQGCSDRTYEKVSRSIGILGELVPIRITFVDSLVTIAISSGQSIHEDYQNVVSAIEDNSTSDCSRTRSSVVSSFSVASASSELTLLRVVKSLSALWSHEAEENAADEKERTSGEGKPKKEAVADAGKGNQNDDIMDKSPADSSELSRQRRMSTERQFRPSMLTGLQGLWSSLDRLLELVSDEIGVKDKKESEGVKNEVPIAREMLNVDRMRSANRSLPPVLARLSPMIEAFLVTHSVEDNRRAEDSKGSDTPKNSPRLRAVASPRPGPSSAPSFDSEGDSFVRSMDGQLAAFVERHRGPINALLRANPRLLESSFKGALRHPQAIDFDNKKAYFRNVLRRRSSEAHASTIRINIRRDRVFDDSYHQLRKRTPDEMKGTLHVQFSGEEGVDAGGVTREWYIILARQIFDPNYVLFTRSAAKAATYQPDKRSYINREHLENFKFVGRIIGKAIHDGQLLDAYFTRSFYKHILGLKPTYHDIEAQDPAYYKSLKWMLENDITGIFDYTMSSEYDEFGKQTVIDLMPNGRNIPVTEENKAEYVRLVTEVRMTKAIEKQIEAFKEGFYELIPHGDCKIFNELELELLMSGLPDIDIADLKANVEYTGYTASSPQVNWFWRCVGKMDQEDLARLVMFVTGTSKVPLEGFSMLQGMNGVQKFQIHRVSGNTLRLPSAHTCFNQLDLPEYSSAEVLSDQLLRAVRECSVGFGFA